MRILAMDRNVRSLTTRIQKGLFGLPVYQVKSNQTGTWVTVPKHIYDKAATLKAQYQSGAAIDNQYQASPYVAEYVRAVAEEFRRLEGMALNTGNYALVMNKFYTKQMKASNLTSDELQIAVEAGNRALNLVGTVPNSYDDSAIDDWANAVFIGAEILSALKIQFNMLQIVPKVDRSDSSSVSPYTRSSLTSALLSAEGLRIPRASYAIAELFTRVIQVGGAEGMSSVESQYFMPAIHGCVLSHFEDQLDALDALSKSALFAGYINQPLVPVSRKWLTTLHVVPYYSDWAQTLLDIIPIADNDGGAAVHELSFDTDINTYYNQAIGQSSLWNAGPFFRSESAGTAATFLHYLTVSADKLSLLYFADRDSTGAGTEVPDTTSRFDFIFQVSEARSSTHRGIFGHDDNFMQYHTITGDEASWDRRASAWLFAAMMAKKLPINVLSRLMPSMTPALSKAGLKLTNANQSKYGSRG
jgi:hypothetical protein